MEKQILNTREAAEFLGISTSTLLRSIIRMQSRFGNTNRIPFYKVGRRILFVRAELERLLNR